MRARRQLLLSPRAVADLEEIADYIARDNPARAASFIAELAAKCRIIAETPELHPARADLAPNLRMAVHGRYLYCTVIFRAKASYASSVCCTAPATCLNFFRAQSLEADPSIPSTETQLSLPNH